MADRRALVITSPGIMSLQDAAELIPGPGEVVARPVHTGLAGNGVTAGFPIDDVVNNDRFPLEAYEEAYQVLRESSGPRGKVILDVSAP